jgi:hypothetical protein
MSGEFQNIGVGPRSDSPASDEVEVKSSSRQQKVAGGVAGLSRFPHQAVLLRFRELTCAAGRIALRCRRCGGGHHHLPARCICTPGARARRWCALSHVVRVLLQLAPDGSGSVSLSNDPGAGAIRARVLANSTLQPDELAALFKSQMVCLSVACAPVSHRSRCRLLNCN